MTIPSPRRAAVLLMAALLASCGDSPTDGGSRDPARMDVVSGGLQQGVVGEELAEALVVRVLDAGGDPVSGQLVNFRVVSGGGSVFAGSALTGSDGIARDRWILGTMARDTQRVEARAVDQQTGQAQVFAVFRAVGTPAAPAAITPVTGAAVTGVPGFALADSLGVRVADRFGNSIVGTTVAWTVTRGGGSVSPASSVTDTAGIARTRWTLGAWSDSTQTVQAAAGVALTTNFVASTGLPAGAALAVVSGNGQARVAGTALPQPLVARLTLADGRPVRGAPITWSVSGGVVTPAVSMTDAQGMVQAQWVLPAAPGAVTATASTPGGMPAGFTATVLAGPPARVEILVGDNQTGYPGQRLPDPLVVRVLDASGNEILAPVDWAVVGEGFLEDFGERRGTTLRTEGHHALKFYPQGAAGTRQVTATSGGVQAVFNVTVLGSRIVLHSPAPEFRYGDSLWVEVDAYATTPITSVTARVLDREIILTNYSGARYHGTLWLNGVPRGRYQVVIRVNPQGTPPDSIVAPFILDRTPVVQVLLPRDSTVASSVRVHATCQDDDPGGCRVLRVSGTSLTGTSEVDGTVAFAQEGAWSVSVSGVDSAGRVTSVTRTGWRAPSGWTQVAEVNGVRVIDADDSRVLFQVDWNQPGRMARILNRATGDTAVLLASGSLGDGRVTPAGALLRGLVGGSSLHLFDWRGGTVLDRGPIGSDTIVVEGDWAAWIGSGVFRQNVATGATERVGPFARDLDLADNGDMVWLSNENEPQVIRWRNGVATALTAAGDGGFVNRRPRTDGVNTAYVRLYTDGPALVLNGPDDRETLARPPFHVSAESMKFDLRDGWMAFSKWGADGVPRLWMRSPAGAVQQASSRQLDEIRVMGPRGQVIYVSGDRMYYTAPPFSGAVDVGPATYYFDRFSPSPVRVVWPGETPYALVGRYVFRIEI